MSQVFAAGNSCPFGGPCGRGVPDPHAVRQSSAMSMHEKPVIWLELNGLSE